MIERDHSNQTNESDFHTISNLQSPYFDHLLAKLFLLTIRDNLRQFPKPIRWMEIGWKL